MPQKIEMIPPFDVFTGNLSGKQDLQYALNDNPAYEAPDGVQYARNYKARYIGNKRKNDGSSYFAVRKRNACLLNDDTRKQMAMLGVVTTIMSTLKNSHPEDWRKIEASYSYKKGVGAIPEDWSLRKWVFNQINGMLFTYSASVTFNSPAYPPYDLVNPFCITEQHALVIPQSTWVKFMPIYGYRWSGSGAIRVATFTIDGKNYFAPYTTILGSELATWEFAYYPGNGNLNPNWRTYAALIDADPEENTVHYGTRSVYANNSSIAQVANDTIIAGMKYSSVLRR